MGVGAAFDADTHDDWLRVPAQLFSNAIVF